MAASLRRRQISLRGCFRSYGSTRVTFLGSRHGRNKPPKRARRHTVRRLLRREKPMVADVALVRTKRSLHFAPALGKQLTAPHAPNERFRLRGADAQHGQRDFGVAPPRPL